MRVLLSAVVSLLLLLTLATVLLTESAPPASPAPAPLVEQARAMGELAGALLTQVPAAALLGAAQSLAIPVPADSPIGGYFRIWPRNSARAAKVAVVAMVLQAGPTRVALTGHDAVTIPPALHQKILDQIDDATALITTATHVHSGPGGCGHGLLESLFLGPAEPGLRATIATAHLEAIAGARARLEPVQLLDGSAQLPELVVNRSERGAPLDSTLDLVALLGGAGLVGRLATFNAHATLIADRDRIDGDYPAALRQQLRRGDPSPLLFAAGATGSAAARRSKGQNPIVALAGELSRSIDDRIQLVARDRDLALAHRRAWLRMPPVRIPLLLGRVLRPDRGDSWVGDRLPVDLLRLGPVLLVSLPGELSAELSSGLRERYAAAGLHLVIASHNGVYGGYFLPGSRYNQPGPERALEFYGPGAGELVVAMLDGVRTGLVSTPR